MDRDPRGVYSFQVGPEHVGANLLDIVSGALYSDVLDIVREYIQNAVDAKAQRVRIVLREDEIWIRDDGVGMTPEGLDGARKVAVSAKDAHSVGFRGIGVYASYAACELLEMITRPKGGDEVYSLTLNFRRMRREATKRAAATPPTAMSLQEALTRFTEIKLFEGEAPMDEGGAFTLVRLRKPQAHLVSALSDLDELTEYLQRAVPLHFAPRHPHAEELIKQLKAHGVDRSAIHVDLTLADKDPGVKGSSHDFYVDAFRKLLRPVVREIRAPGVGKMAVLWFAVHKEPRAIRKHPHGIQIRIKGFGIGTVDIVRKLWGRAGSGILYQHLVGELHVVHPALRPSAERANIEDSPTRKRLTGELRTMFKKISGWIEGRQTVLRTIVRREETSIEDTDEELDRLCAEYGAVPVLKRSEIMNSKAVKARLSGDTGDDQDGPSDPGGDDDEDQPNDPTDEETDSDPRPKGPVPTLSNMLLGLEVDWPPKVAGKVFAALDRAVTTALDKEAQLALRTEARERLEALAL